MLVTVRQDILKIALDLVKAGVSTRSTLPVLGNVLLTAKQELMQPGTLTLSATDLEIFVAVEIQAVVERVGAITLPAAMLTSIVAALPEEPLDIELDERTQTASITVGIRKDEKKKKSVHKLKGIDAEDFPLAPKESENDSVFEISAYEFARSIQAAIVAASRDESRTTLTGVEITVGENKPWTVTATDGYQLAIVQCNNPHTTSETNVIVPWKALRTMGAFMKNGTNTAILRIPKEGNKITMQIADKDPHVSGILKFMVHATLLDVKFPEYKKIVPKEHDTTVTLAPADLLKALAIASAFADEKKSIMLDVGIDTLIVRNEMNPHSGGDCTSIVAADIQGPELTMMINVAMLSGVVSTLTQYPLIVLGFTAPGKPLTIGVNNMPEAERLHVIMPMQINEPKPKSAQPTNEELAERYAAGVAAATAFKNSVTAIAPDTSEPEPADNPDIEQEEAEPVTG